MSCFIMEEKPVAALADWIADLCNYGLNAFGMDAPRSLERAMRPCIENGFYDEKTIYDLLHNLNKAAYLGRYSHIDGIESEVENWEPYQPNPQHGMLYGCIVRPGWEDAMLKRLDCFLYQCAEDPVYGCQLYNAIEELDDALAGHIARAKPEYNAAPWGE